MADEHDDRDATKSYAVLAQGAIVGHYRIVEKIGAGGMGVVYLAEDTELNRKVALKFLPPHLCQDDDCRTRFKREAQAAARLDHPNIVPIHEVGEFQGRPYFAMAHIEGEPLRDVIKKGMLSIDEAIDLAVQICEGLQEAHDAGIIHRDVKPGNIILDHKGRPRLLDFGLATIQGTERLTDTGSTLGTIGYMSPEQIQVKQIDRRSDLFSFGVVLYELITGRLPFKGENEAATLQSVLNDIPEPLARYKSGVTAELQQIVSKLLEKNPELRYQHTDDLLVDLKKAAQQFESGPSDEQPSIAVLPFANLSADPEQEYFCDGMAEEIINALTRIENLRVIARTSAFSFKGKALDIREIGRKLGVGTILEGSVRKAGNRLRITAQLISISDGSHLWSERYDREMADVFEIQDDVTGSIINKLRPQLLKKDRDKIPHHQRKNGEAYNEYLKGLYFYNKRSEDALKRSLKHFTRATQIDPGYALAYSGIADAYNVMAGYAVLVPKDAQRKAMEAANKALELDSSLGEAYCILGVIQWERDHNREAAEKLFETALRLNPDSTRTLLAVGEIYLTQKRIEEASELINKAIQLDPLSLIARMVGAIQQYCMQNYDDAIAMFDNVVLMDPLFVPAYRYRSLTHALKSDYASALRDAQKAEELSPENPIYLAHLGFVYGRSGDNAKARECLSILEKLSERRFVPSYEKALIYLGMGRLDTVMDHLEKAVDEGYYRILDIYAEPIFFGLMTNERFKNCLVRLNLVQEH